jgi:UDP:flavonoid glycosyltransferase YjiC (YdhE family)
MVALSLALRARGHEVQLAVPPNSAALARSLGVEAIPVGADYEALSKASQNGSTREIFRLLPRLKEEVRSQLQALEERSEKAHLIIGASALTIGGLLSAKRGVPYVFFSMCPQIFPSAHHPSPMVPAQRLPRWLNRLSWRLNRWGWQRLLAETMNHERRARGLGPLNDVWDELTGRYPMVASDPAIAPAPLDHPVPIAQLGALFIEDPTPLSLETSAFLDAGPPPVYLGFGSMSDPNPRATTERILESVRRAGVRALVSRGWAQLEPTAAPPPDVLFIGPEPHAKLFPRCAAVVHHGGAGTTHAAARAGVPQVVMPQLLDQHYWAERLRVAGVTPGSVGRYRRNPQPLARALRACVDRSDIRERALALADRISTDGLGRTCELLERIAGTQPALALERRVGN